MLSSSLHPFFQKGNLNPSLEKRGRGDLRWDGGGIISGTSDSGNKVVGNPKATRSQIGDANEAMGSIRNIRPTAKGCDCGLWSRRSLVGTRRKKPERA